MSEEALDLLTNTINIENKRLDLDKIFEHPFFKKGKGLSRETFPDYNDKDYKNKIFKLSQELGIKPINRKIKSNIEKDINKKNTHKKRNRNNIPSYTSSSSSSSHEKSNSYSSSFDDGSKSLNKISVENNVKNINPPEKGLGGKNVEMFEDNMRKSFKNISSPNIQVEEDFKKSINFNKTIKVEMEKIFFI